MDKRNSILKAAFTQQTLFNRQTRVDKRRMAHVNHTTTINKHIGKLLETKSTSLYSGQLFLKLFCVDKLAFDVWTIAKRLFDTLN